MGKVASFLFKLLGPVGWVIDPVAKVTSLITDYQQRSQDAKTEKERMYWQAKADAATNRLENIKSGERWQSVAVINAIIRLLLVLPFVIYLWKLIPVDKVFFPGNATDDLSPKLWDVFGIILLYFFGSSLIDRFGGKQ